MSISRLCCYNRFAATNPLRTEEGGNAVMLKWKLNLSCEVIHSFMKPIIADFCENMSLVLSFELPVLNQHGARQSKWRCRSFKIKGNQCTFAFWLLAVANCYFGSLMPLGALQIELDVNLVTSSGTKKLLLDLADFCRPSLFEPRVPILALKCFWRPHIFGIWPLWAKCALKQEDGKT